MAHHPGNPSRILSRLQHQGCKSVSGLIEISQPWEDVHVPSARGRFQVRLDASYYSP
jgi:hypothetical protein